MTIDHRCESDGCPKKYAEFFLGFLNKSIARYIYPLTYWVADLPYKH